MNEGNMGGEGFQPQRDISGDAVAQLFDSIAFDYDGKRGVVEVDACSNQDAVVVFVGPNTDLSDHEALVTEIEGRPVVYERAEDMPELLDSSESK